MIKQIIATLLFVCIGVFTLHAQTDIEKIKTGLHSAKMLNMKKQLSYIMK